MKTRVIRFPTEGTQKAMEDLAPGETVVAVYPVRMMPAGDMRFNGMNVTELMAIIQVPEETPYRGRGVGMPIV